MPASFFISPFFTLGPMGIASPPSFGAALDEDFEKTVYGFFEFGEFRLILYERKNVPGESAPSAR